jgi:ubiquinone/menaquinone biosynthesis C-methylase UbiE
MPHLCPWWLGPFLAGGWRRRVQDPLAVLAPHLRPGLTVLDIGCGMGFFTLPAAQLVGPEGRVVAVDLQPRMLAGLARRARAAGLAERIISHPCAKDSLELPPADADFALAFAVAHEVLDRPRLFAEIAAALKPGARLLLAEPPHVKPETFEAELAEAVAAGFAVVERPVIARSLAAVLERAGEG